MWTLYFILSVSTLIFFLFAAFAVNIALHKKSKKISVLKMLIAGTFVSAFFLFMPVHTVTTEQGFMRPILLSVFNAAQLFAGGTEFEIVNSSLVLSSDAIIPLYHVWAAALFVFAPALTFTFALTFIKNASAYVGYWLGFFKKTYVFSSLNERSLALGRDIMLNNRRACIIYTDVDGGDDGNELADDARKFGAICFKKELSTIKFGFHKPLSDILFFTIGDDEAENLDEALKLVERYKKRRNTHIYLFSTKLESELLLATLDRGEIKLRRVNEVQSLINRTLYESGERVFKMAVPSEDGVKDISAVVVGMGAHGREMVKALSWFCQMDGYRAEINAFDPDPSASDRFRALAPELMDEKYNGVYVEGEAYYSIKIHSGIDTESYSFMSQISEIKNASYVFISLGDDESNIKTAVNLRMILERVGRHPVIQAVVTGTRQKKALSGIKNYRNQEYDIEFIGDTDSSYAEKVIIDSELEGDALVRHLKWGNEEDFWAYEYNYRSSMASAIHMSVRIKLGTAGAGKRGDELTEEERDAIELLEHKRWNAYMRSEGYVYSGSRDPSSRNVLAKTHHDLVDFASLSEEDKRKDSNVGSN